MKLIQVFEWLKMPHELSDEFQAIHEASNDSYVRYYPNRIGNMVRYVSNPDMNAWLLEQGMENDIDDPYFYVLIHVDW